MSYEPCKNPNCHSFGKSHPNCKCTPMMAEGGSVVADEDVTPDEPHNKEVDPDGVTPDPVAGQEVDVEDVIPDKPADEYETPAQQALLVGEAAARGVAGPLATGLELGLSKIGVPGISAKDQAGRQAASPNLNTGVETASTLASLATGFGEAGLALKGAGAMANYARLGKTGAAFLKGIIANGVMQGGDEISKALLGQGDPESPIASAIGHTALSTLFGGLLGVAGSEVGKASGAGLKAIADSKLGEKGAEWLAGFGHAASNGELGSEPATKLFTSGYKAYQKATTNLGAIAGAAAGSTFPIAGPFSAVLGKEAGEKLIGPIIGKAASSKYAVPAVIKWLSGGAEGSLSGLLDYASNVSKGSTAINKGVDSLFKAGTQQAIDKGHTKDIEMLRDYIGNGGVDQNIKEEAQQQDPATPAFAHGGMVEAQQQQQPKTAAPLFQAHDPLEKHYPAENMMLNAARGRVSNYLSSLQPQKHTPKLAFDDEPDQREAKKTYDKALEIAVNPLSVMSHIKAGTLEADHIKHLTSLYPEVTGQLQKKLTQRIVQAQVDDEKPSYKVRQGLSMFMGTALSSELTPQGIQAAQATFAQKKAQQQQQQQQGQDKPKRGTASLGKADQSYMTPDQSRMARQSKV